MSSALYYVLLCGIAYLCVGGLTTLWLVISSARTDEDKSGIYAVYAIVGVIWPVLLLMRFLLSLVSAFTRPVVNRLAANP